MSNEMFSSAAIPNRPPIKEFDSFLQDFFGNYIAQRYPSHFEKLGRKQDFLKEFLSTAIFNADLNGNELSSSSAYRYLDFDLHEADKIEGRKANILWLFKQYISELEQQNKKPDWVHSYVDPLVAPFQPKTRWKSFKIFDLKAALPPHATPTIPVEDIDPKPAPAIVTEPEVKTAGILSKLKYSPSFMRSTAISVLLGGVSRFALVSACSTAGLSMLPASFIAGMGVGFVTSAYKNRANIKEEVSRETGFWRKTSAFIKGSFKSQGFYHLVFNGAAAGFGVWGADAIADLWCGNQALTEALSDAQGENLRLERELEGANREIEELKGSLAEAEEVNKGLVDENSTLKRELESAHSDNLELKEELESARAGCDSVCEKPIDKPLVVIEPEVVPAFDHSKVVNAGAFLNGVAGDDLDLVRSFIQSAGEFGGVDGDLVSLVENKLADESVRFIVTEDSAKAVMAYSAELKAGLIDGSVTQAEYSLALTKLFEQLSAADFVASGDRLSSAALKASAIAANQNVFEQLVPKAN